MPNLVLGVSGSISAYRAADLSRDLMRAGYEVRVCLTDGAQGFVTPTLFETLTGHPCLSCVFDEPERGRMAHIDWARWADLLVIAPGSANTINRLAFGLADDMLTTLALAYEGAILIAPAMNPSMYAHPTTREALGRLEDLGAVLVSPQEGDVASGEVGLGKLAANADIVSAVLEIGKRSQSWRGKKVVITSGPTQEAIDDVRFLSNRSSGKMGAALAQAALWRGAEVVVIAGPGSARYPKGARVVRVTSALQMLDAGTAEAMDAHVIIGAAAVADYRPANRAEGKLRRKDEPLKLDLVPNPDVLKAMVDTAMPGTLKIGFAAEPDAGTEVGRQKLMRKGLDAIAINDISRSDAGFDVSTNELTLIRREGDAITSGTLSKIGCAQWLLDQLEAGQ